MNTNITHNPKTGLFEFDGKLFADLEAVRHYQEVTGTPATAPNNGKITVEVIYTVQCKELNVYQEFSDFDTAHTFATQLEQDCPTAHIEKAKVTLFLMIGIMTIGGRYERISQNPIQAQTHL